MPPVMGSGRTMLTSMTNRVPRTAIQARVEGWDLISTRSRH